MLDARAARVASLKTREDAERRQAEVRRQILDLVGGLPRAPEKVEPRRFGTAQEDGFRIENVTHRAGCASHRRARKRLHSISLYLPDRQLGPKQNAPADAITPEANSGLLEQSAMESYDNVDLELVWRTRHPSLQIHVELTDCSARASRRTTSSKGSGSLRNMGRMTL